MSDTFDIVEKLTEELAEKEDKIMALEKLVRELAQKEHRCVRERWSISEEERVGDALWEWGKDFADEVKSMANNFMFIKSRGSRWWLCDWVSDEQWAREDREYYENMKAQEESESDDEDFNPFADLDDDSDDDE